VGFRRGLDVAGRDFRSGFRRARDPGDVVGVAGASSVATAGEIVSAGVVSTEPRLAE